MRIPPSLLFGLGRFLLFILLEATCLYLVSNNGIVQRYRLIGKLREVQGYFWEKHAAIEEYSSLRKANEELSAQNALLMHQLQQMKENPIQDDTLKAPYSFIIAKVIRNTVGSTHNYLLIDKGYNHGIHEDMGVVTPNGVIGITRAVSANYSYVLSFLNTSQQVSAKIGNTDAFGPLRWNPQKPGTAILSEIPQHLQISPQDTIYTSGYSSFFPPDIPLGVVEGSRIVNGVHLNIDVRLLQEFKSIKHVMVVENTNREEIDSLVKGVKQ